MDIGVDGMIKCEWIKDSPRADVARKPGQLPPVEAVFTDKFLPVKQ